MRVALVVEGVSSAPLVVTVVDGVWSLEAEPGTSMIVYQGSLEGTKCWPTRMQVTLAPGGQNVIEFASEPFIRVVDSSTREDLASASLMKRALGLGVEAGILPHAGVFGEVALPPPLPTPMPASSLRESGEYLFTGEGFTWGSACRTSDPASRVVVLDPAGALRLKASEGSAALPDHCTLRLFAPAREERSKPLYSIPFQERRLDSLLPKVREGEYGVEIVRSPRATSERVLFSSSVRITRDRETVLEVQLAPSDVPDETMVQFVITGEDEALDRIQALAIDPRRVLAVDPKSMSWRRAENVASRAPGVLEYEPLALAPGTYLLDLRTLGYVAQVDIPVDSFHLQEVPLAPLCRYTLAVTDAHGNHIGLDSLQYASSEMAAEPLNRLPPLGASLMGAVSPFSFDAVCGTLKLTFWSQQYGRRFLVLDGHGEHRFDLSLEPVSEIRLRLAQGGETFLVPDSWWGRYRLHDEDNMEVRSTLEFEGASALGWHSEALLQPQVTGALVFTFPDPLGGTGTVDIPVQVRPGRQTLTLDVGSGTLVP